MVTQHQVCPHSNVSSSWAGQRIPLSRSDSELLQGSLVGGQKLQTGRSRSVVHTEHGLDVEQRHDAREQLAVV